MCPSRRGSKPGKAVLMDLMFPSNKGQHCAVRKIILRHLRLANPFSAVECLQLRNLQRALKSKAAVFEVLLLMHHLDLMHVVYTAADTMARPCSVADKRLACDPAKFKTQYEVYSCLDSISEATACALDDGLYQAMSCPDGPALGSIPREFCSFM